MSAAVRDATERKRAEAKFRDLLEAAPDAIVGVDRSGSIALVNTRAEELFGYGRDELLGRSVELLVPDHAKGIHPTHRAGYAGDPHPRPMGMGMELAGRRKDGTEFPAEISLSAIDTEDGLIISAAVRDVTERRQAQAEHERLRAQAERERLEAQMQRSQRLESLGQLAGGVAHDFNNLLAVILNYTAFVGGQLEDAAAEADGERWVTAHRDIAEVHRAARRASELTQQLLAFGRREVVEPQQLDLGRVLRDVERLLRRSLGEHVQLTIVAADDLPPVLADPGQLEQVLVNLAVNARDAMPAGGQLTLRTDVLEVAPSFAAGRPGLRGGTYVRLMVVDTGAGMERGVVERAFEPFFTTKPIGEGSGLGLATVHGIVRQAGGYVDITSEPGEGTTVAVLLPATQGAPVVDVPQQADERRPVSGGGETVLVVDDQPALREVIERILSFAGYTVLTAGSGAEAVRLAGSHPGEIHVLLTDVVMPEMLGEQVAEHVIARRPSAHVLYMSGYAHPHLASQGTLEPGVSLLQKPFGAEDLLAKLRELLESSDERDR